MQSKPHAPKTDAETALLRELSVNGSADRDRLLTLLCEQAPPPANDIPSLPEELRRRLEEKFGSAPQPAPTAQPAGSVASTSAPQRQHGPGWFAQLSAWFRETLGAHPLAYGGGLVATACVVAFVLLSHGPQPVDGDTMRGTTTPDPAVGTNGIVWYWLGKADPPLQAAVAPVLGNAHFTDAASLAELPVPKANNNIIAIDPQSGAWLKTATGEPQSFAAEGIPGSPEWPAALNKAAQTALAAVPKK